MKENMILFTLIFCSFSAFAQYDTFEYPRESLSPGTECFSGTIWEKHDYASRLVDKYAFLVKEDAISGLHPEVEESGNLCPKLVFHVETRKDLAPAKAIVESAITETDIVIDYEVSGVFRF